MRVRLLTALAGVFAAGALTARGQDPKADPALFPLIDSAGQHVVRGAYTANVVPAPFRAHLVVDDRFARTPPAKTDEERDPRDRTGKIHCLICENGLAPTVAVFVRGDPAKFGAADGLGKLVKGTDGLVTKYRADKLAAYVMFLTLKGGEKAVTVKAPDGKDLKVAVDLEYPHDEERASKVAAVRAFGTAVAAPNVPLGLSPDRSKGVTAFAIADTAPVTVVIYSRLRMLQRWEFAPNELTDEKIAEVLAATENMVRGAKR